MRPAKAALVALQFRHRAPRWDCEPRLYGGCSWPGVMTLGDAGGAARPGDLAGPTAALEESASWRRSRAPRQHLPVPLPADPSPFAKVQVTGHFRDDLAASYGAEVRDTPAGPVAGHASDRAAASATDGDAVLVDRGWVPRHARQPMRRRHGEATVAGLHPSGRQARLVQRRRQSGDAAVLHARSGRDRRGARAAARRAVHPGRAGTEPAAALSGPGADICRGRRTTICPTRSPGMASRSRSW